MNANSLADVGIYTTPHNEVSRLAKLAKEAGLDGVVCSPKEAAMLRQHLGEEFVLVTPGIRMGDEPPDDQKRTATPKEAILAGASYLVVGRPITKAVAPRGAVLRILDDINDALEGQ